MEQTGAALEHVARADARDVKGDYHPSRHARDEDRERRPRGSVAAEEPCESPLDLVLADCGSTTVLPYP
jgi:hypothetical protein